MLVQIGVEVVLEIPLNKAVLSEINGGRCYKTTVTHAYVASKFWGFV